MSTDALQNLIDAEQNIRQLILPTRVDEFGAYSDEELIRIDAYILFSHAEVETYLEQLATKIANDTEANLRAGKINRTCAALVTYYRPERENVPSINKIPANDVITTISFKCLQKHLTTISGNNGIKEDSLCNLLLPLGFDFSNVDNLLIAELESLGSARGRIAHMSYANPVRRVITEPSVASGRMDALLTLLHAFDTEFVQQFPPIAAPQAAMPTV